MLTIIGNGMGGYNFDNISYDLTQFDIILCDKNFNITNQNLKILKLSYKETLNYIDQNIDNQNIAYIVTGSPYFYSAGVLIAQKYNNVKIIDNQSSLQYMIQKLKLNYANISTVSLHGRKDIDLNRFLTNKYTFVLCDYNSIAKLQNILQYFSNDDIKVTIGYKLGYNNEIVSKIDIFNFDTQRFDLNSLYVLVIEKLFEDSFLRNDNDFVTQRGMITKQFKRDFALQNLFLLPNQILWDIGAGSGSCGIEASKRYKTRTIFFENKKERYNNIITNLKKHKVIDAQIFFGNACDNFDKITTNPNRIFVGGGLESIAPKLQYLYDRLEDNGIMLINIITLKNLTTAIQYLDKFNLKYNIISYSMTTYKEYLGLIEPQRELYSIIIKK
jgi:precorrin-6Y C5,15-methyltransferase (decarboxylating)